MECKYIDEVTEEWVLEHCSLNQSDLCVVEEANIAGNIRQKISSLGTSLVSFISLRSLDISRNNISSLDGLQYCMALETINIYYNNVSNLSEVLKLATNSKLQEIDIRLNPVSVMSTEYRLMLVHALTSLRVLDKVPVTDKDRMLSLSYHSTDQAGHLTGYHGDGVAAKDFRLQNVSAADENLRETTHSPTASLKSGKSSVNSSCEQFIKALRPPLTILQPKRDAYDAYSVHGSFTPNPRKSKCKLSVSSSFEEFIKTLRPDSAEGTPVSATLTEKFKEGSAVVDENKKLREKCRAYKDKYNQVLSERISKESYVKLQEDYYKCLKKTDEMDAINKISNEELTALRQHIENLTKENKSLKQELAIKEQVTEVDKQIKRAAGHVDARPRKARGSDRRIHKQI